MSRSSVLALLSCLISGVARAEPLVADRPGVGETTSIVRPGAIQLEGGIQLERQTSAAGPDTDTLTLPQPLLRVGVHRAMELRLAADGLIYEDRDGASDRTSGSDLELGAKLRFFEQDGWRPVIGLLVAVSFPTGDRAVTSDGIDPRGSLLVNWELDERFGLDANFGFAGPTQGVDDSDRVFEVDPSVSLEGSLTSRWSAFVEYFSTIRASREEDEHGMDGGFTYLLSDDLQIDLSAGAGLNRAAPDFFVGFGIAWRFRLR